jgi:hypothetical protein
VTEQVHFVAEGVERLLGFVPEVFPVSARLALSGKTSSDANGAPRLLAESRFPELEHYISTTLDERGRLQLKLSNPLGIAERIARTSAMAAQERLALLKDDMMLLDSIDRQLGAYRGDMQRDFDVRLEHVDSIINEMTVRGVDYLDSTLRIGRIVDLFRQKVLKEEFERVVVSDAPERLDRLSQDLIDWMVDQDLRLWRSVTEQLDRRQRAGQPGPALAGTFEYDRRALLGSLGQTARGVLTRHDHQREATQLAASVREAVTQATLLEAGAIGLGAVSMAIVGSAAADVTGLFAASVLAGVGLWLLPRKRRQARAQFRTRTDELRSRLDRALTDEFHRELDRGIQRIRDALAPYTRFLRSEQERAEAVVRELGQILDDLARLKVAVEAL